jgi:predicted ATPase/DNA-binding CsgD family transcriptional regulator
MAFPKWQAQNEGLSKRAVEILRLLAEGMSDREIAERLVMTTNTIKWYNRQIYGILGVGSRTQAIARARELQLLNEAPEPAPSLNIFQHTPKHSLPIEATRFIGRKQEIEAIHRLLDTAHLLTLVGPPGTGKTRLALQIAWELVDTFRQGVYFVSLAPISDPALVINAIASAVGVNEAHGQALIDTLKHVLRESHMLLILDNFEHLLPAATQVSELLYGAPYLKVLATSREPLHLYGEQEYAVPPLELPDAKHLDPLTLIDCESTALFIQQARAVRSDFELTAENAADIVKICVRLEGLPLAIELAAARIKLLTPQILLTRLSSRLDTLKGGAHDLPPRQRTLRSTIEWSYNLLNEGEKILFARLAIFRGGCSLDAIEAVCSENLPLDVFDGVASLVDKSLVQQKESAGGEPRFVMLEMIQEYAREQLNASGEALTMQRCHTEYFVQMTERAQPELRRSGFPYWMDRLESDADNLRVALEWSLEENGDVVLGLRLVASLRDFWIMSSHFVQGENWTQRALSKATDAPAELRVAALTTAGIVLYYSSHERALQKQVLQEAVELARAVDDRLNLAWALIWLGIASIGEPSEYEDAMTLSEEGLAIFRELDFKPGIAQALNSIGELTRVYGDDKLAQSMYEECLLLVRETGEKRREAMILNNLGCLMMRRTDYIQAEQLFRSALSKRMQVGHDRRGAVTNILFLAGAIAATGDPERAVRLFGAAEALLEPMGVKLEPGDQPEHDRDLTYVRAHLDDATFQRYWKEGRALSLEQAAAYALSRGDAQ